MIAPDSKMLIGAPPPLGVVVDQDRHAVIGIDLQKVGLELVAAPDIAGNQIVIETQFFEQDRDLLPVRRRPKVEIEHRKLLFRLLSGGPLRER